MDKTIGRVFVVLALVIAVISNFVPKDLFDFVMLGATLLGATGTYLVFAEED